MNIYGEGVMENTFLFTKTLRYLQIEYTLQIRDLANLYLYLLGNCIYLALALQDPIIPSKIRKYISVMVLLTIFPGLHRSDFVVLFKNVGGLLSCIAQCLEGGDILWALLRDMMGRQMCRTHMMYTL